MKNILILFFTAAFLFMAQDSNAQVKKALRKQATKAATRAATDAVEDEIKDQAVDFAKDQVDGAISQQKANMDKDKAEKKKQELISKSVGNKPTSYQPPASIDFDVSVSYSGSGGSSSINHKIWYNGNDAFLGLEESNFEPGTSVFVLGDFTKSVISTFAMRQKKYVSLSAGNDQLASLAIAGDKSSRLNLGNMSLKDSGNTKTILGHECKEITVNSDGLKGSIWVATDIPHNGQNLFALCASKSNSSVDGSPDLKKGVVLSYSLTNSSSNSTIEATATKVDASPNAISPRGFSSAID